MTKTTYIKFEMDGCNPCAMSANFIKEQTTITVEVLTNPDVELSSLENKLYVVNVGETPELASQFEIASVPTFIKLENGVETERFSGFQPPKLKQIEADLK